MLRSFSDLCLMVLIPVRASTRVDLPGSGLVLRNQNEHTMRNVTKRSNVNSGLVLDDL